jgi:hypothetical protein
MYAKIRNTLVNVNFTKNTSVSIVAWALVTADSVDTGRISWAMSWNIITFIHINSANGTAVSCVVTITTECITDRCIFSTYAPVHTRVRSTGGNINLRCYTFASIQVILTGASDKISGVCREYDPELSHGISNNSCRIQQGNGVGVPVLIPWVSLRENHTLSLCIVTIGASCDMPRIRRD